MHPGGRIDSMHAVVIPGAAWMSRQHVTCLIQLDRSPFWPIGVHIGHVDTPRCSWVCVGMKTNPQDRSGGLSDRPGVPTERLSRHISIGIDSSDTKGYYPSVLKRSSYSYWIYIAREAYKLRSAVTVRCGAAVVFLRCVQRGTRHQRALGDPPRADGDA